MNMVKLSPPWCKLYREVDALFGRDPQINVVYDEEANIITLYVDNTEKAAALMQLLPSEKVMGNVVVKINVVPANQNAVSERVELYKAAFTGNPAFSKIQSVSLPFFSTNYLIFNPEVIQFYNDNLQDLNGNWTGVMEDIARDVFEAETDICFCTDALKESKVVKVNTKDAKASKTEAK